MNIYYTAKDIEEMAAKGIQEIDLSAGITLTDFARETAQQFNIALVNKARQPVQQASTPAPRAANQGSSKYNKPKGCLHGSPSRSVVSDTAVPNPDLNSTNSTTVNRLIDLMGKVVKRGG